MAYLVIDTKVKQSGELVVGQLKVIDLTALAARHRESYLLHPEAPLLMFALFHHTVGMF